MKKNYGSYLNVYKVFLHFVLLASNPIKSKAKEKFKRNRETYFVPKKFVQPENSFAGF